MQLAPNLHGVVAAFDGARGQVLPVSVERTSLHWLSVLLLAPMAWAQSVWVLPVLTALALSDPYNRKQTDATSG